jgi:hypothetical protein
MTQTIVGLFDSVSEAQSALDRLGREALPTPTCTYLRRAKVAAEKCQTTL